MTAILTARAMTKRFGTTPVLTQIDLRVAAEELVVVTGPVGSGCSALLRCLGGVYRPTTGAIVVALDEESVDLSTCDTRTVAWLQRHHLAHFDGTLASSPSQNAANVVARRAGIERSEAVAALHRLGCSDLTDKPIGRLRPEQRRAVALAAALSTSSAVLLLDNPESAADPNRVTDWMNERRTAGAAIVAVARSRGPLTAIATATAVLNGGKLQWTAS